MSKTSKRRSYSLSEDAVMLLFQWKLHTGRKYEDMLSSSIFITHLLCEQMKSEGISYDDFLKSIIDTDLSKLSKNDVNSIEELIKHLSDSKKN